MSQWDEIRHLRCLTDLVRFSNHGQNKLAPRGRRKTKKEIIWESTVSANFTQRPQFSQKRSRIANYENENCDMTFKASLLKYQKQVEKY